MESNMSIRQRDTNRKELVKAIIRQNGGRIFTVIAKRKEPKVSYVMEYKHQSTNIQYPEVLKPADYNKLPTEDKLLYTQVVEHFMEMTCRTGVKKDLKGGASTIAHHDDLISVNLTNGKGYRCFSAYNVLEIRAGGTVIKFKEEDVLSFNQ
ncbi:hypothetical protein [Klebsiella phage vB_KvaP_F5M1D]|nr:hypothetical protein [Klebsiella phage vB_KvaP_F5M1D]